MNRSVLLSGAMFAALVLPAHANDLTIGTATTSPVATSAAANGTPGNITITGSGSVAISATGAAVTLDSNHYVSNSGNISNTAGDVSIGVNILGNTSGGFVNAGNVSVPGTGTPPSSPGQAGILLNGNGSFTGDIVALTGSTVTVSGKGAKAISIESTLAGNLTLGGRIDAAGEASSGVAVSAPVNGRLLNTGSIASASGSTSTTTVNPSPGPALAIGRSVSGGILNAGPVNGADPAAKATISTNGAVPSVLIAPSAGGDIGSVSLGVFADANDPGYSLLNRGVISATGNQPSISTVAIRIGENAGNNNALTTVLSGGFFNRGSIAAASTSDNGNATSAISSVTDATAIVVGARATVPSLVNVAAGNITATTGGPVGGTATAISVVSGGSLVSLNNAGSIVASANATGSASAPSAYGIRDGGGKLTGIVNSGTISATQTTPGGTQNMIAADLSAATSATAFANSGTVNGSILFGSAAGNTLTIEGAGASVTGTVRTTGSGTVNVAISGGGTGGKLVTTGIGKAGTLTVGAGGRLDVTIDQTDNTTIVASGPVSFDAASRLHLTFETLPLAGGNVTLLSSDTSLAFGNFGATVEPFAMPFLFAGNLTTDAKNLVLGLHRKSAGEIGLTGDAAALFEPAMKAAGEDAAFEAAVTELTSAAEVQSAMDQMLPIVSDATRRMAVTLTDSATGVVAARQRSLAMASDPGGGVSVWVQGFRNEYSDTGQHGYDGDGAGGTIGIDISRSDRGHVGAAFTLYKSDVAKAMPATTKTSVQWRLFSFYMGGRIGDLFLNAQSGIGTASASGERTVNVGSLTRVATTAAWTELLAAGSFGGGYIFRVGQFAIAPQAAVDGMYLGSSAYRDTGGGSAVNLNVESRGEHSVRAFAGMTASDTFQLGQVRLVPQLLAGWSQEFLTGPTPIRGRFSAVSGTGFELAGPRADDSRFVLGGGLGVAFGDWMAGLNYNATKGSSSLVQSASASVTARF